MLATLAALLAFLFPLAYSPGPGNLFFAALGARLGFRAALPALMGYHIATLVVTLAAGLAFLGADARFAGLLPLLRLPGAAYILWLAWRLWHADPAGATDAGGRSGIRDGAVLLLLNPKAYTIIALVFAQFLGRDGVAGLAGIGMLAIAFTMNNLLAFVIFAAGGDRLARRLRSRKDAQSLNRAFALVLSGVALWMAWPAGR
ncbi:MAG: LysE family transporter [Paracoccaceae bacterium]